MYIRPFVEQREHQVLFTMAGSGDQLTYGEFEARTNQLAHFFRDCGLKAHDHYSIFMENNTRYLEACGGGERAGLYYTCINSYLTADELAFIVNNSESKVLITSTAKAEIAAEALQQCPQIRACLVVGQSTPEGMQNFEDTIATYPTSPIADEQLGTPMLYSSGTTGRPKGILRPLPAEPPSENLPVMNFLSQLWRYRDGMRYLSPAPLYHSAPQAAVGLTFRAGGTCVVMEKFDPLQYLALIEQHQISHSQLVPTMFSRMLKLPESERMKHDLSSLEIAVHAAAPCPAQVKRDMIEWWGPIIFEYYGATEGLGFVACDSEEWLAHEGTVGKVMLGDLHILDDEMQPCDTGDIGTVWFKTATPFEYFNDQTKTKEATSSDGTMTTVNDVGYVDKDGFLYLTDRKTYMIISGGVNIYPQETEDLLITHPKVADAAVFGVPNEDLGEEVKAVVQVMPDIEPNETLIGELIDYCHEHLSRQKCPRSIDFETELPRLPTGKLYKRLLRDRYWGEGKNKIV